MKNFAIVFLALTFAAPVLAADNPELSLLYEKDQAARMHQPIDWTVVGKKDEEHRRRVLELLKEQKVVSASDYLHAAMIMQHGRTFEDFRLAGSLATIASIIDPELDRARWLTAAAWDRALVEKDVPQWYGTQSRRDAGGKQVLYKIDEGVVTDEERKSLDVPSLQEAKDMLKQINGER